MSLPEPAGVPAPPMSAWTVRGRVVSLDRPLLLGILNVTPDSFSDGGQWLDHGRAVAHAEQMVAEGADIIDVGGESTRPQGASEVDVEEEARRILPVVREIARRMPDVLISVDTVKSQVAERAIVVGAHIVNDVSALRLDPRMGALCAREAAGLILMHSRGGVSTMGTYADAQYGDDPTGEVIDELRERIAQARSSGNSDQRIVVDPGLGFSKRAEHSLRVLAELPRLAALGFPVLVGASRKRFVGSLSGTTDPADRVHGTTGANVIALSLGARLFRVHDVAAARQALDVAWAVMQARNTPAIAGA